MSKNNTMNNSAACQNPRDGFKRARDLSLSKINGLLKKESGAVYSYVATSATFQGDDLVQKGSGLNFEGGRLTLCMCKHSMRTYPGVRTGAWIAVFASGAGSQPHRLFALMKIGETFNSHAQLWNALAPEVRSKKSAKANRFGDVYKPKPDAGRDELARGNYQPLHRNHPHHGEEQIQRKDVSYRNWRTGEIAKLLLGDARHSYLWMQPHVAFKGRHPRTKRWESLAEFLEELQEDKS